MSKYADIEQIKKIIRSEWVKYMPSDLDINLSFVLGKIAEVPIIEVSDKADRPFEYFEGVEDGKAECDNCIWNVCNYNKIDWEVSEDCISREYMLRALNGYGKDWQEDCEIADVIRNAPSVVPTTVLTAERR